MKNNGGSPPSQKQGSQKGVGGACSPRKIGTGELMTGPAVTDPGHSRPESTATCCCSLTAMMAVHHIVGEHAQACIT